MAAQDPNKEWDGDDDGDPVDQKTGTAKSAASTSPAEPAATVKTPTATDSAPAKTEAGKAGDKSKNETPPVQPEQPASRVMWRRTEVPQPKGTHPSALGASGVNANPIAGQAQVVAEEKLPETVELELPADINKCYSILKAAEQMPGDTRLKRHVRGLKINLVKAHIFKIQQGLPVTAIGASELAVGHKSHPAALKTTKLEYLARNEPLIAELLGQYNKALLTIAELEAKIKQLETKKTE